MLAPLQALKDHLMITQVYATTLIDDMKGKSRKAGIGWEPRAFLTRYTRVNERKHDRVRFILIIALVQFASISDLIGHEDMPKFKCGERAKFGAEVAKESARNEKITKKSLKAKSRAYAGETLNETDSIRCKVHYWTFGYGLSSLPYGGQFPLSDSPSNLGSTVLTGRAVFQPIVGHSLIHHCLNLFSCALFSTSTATNPDIFSIKSKPLFLLPRENDPSPVLGIFKLGCTSLTPLSKFGGPRPRLAPFGNTSRKDEMSQQPMLFCEIFDVWDIDFMSPFRT
ncbi:hypothetical protein PIB30_085146 [Stylosanthes scabra]|uniref:Uncharacterized protein n=1 Tax=Stylosanthes scabra TaxID=79078 RepID=A0ABU6TSA1_9FABA|nr:hypothetical protein [Stylosanthes scabra]